MKVLKDELTELGCIATGTKERLAHRLFTVTQSKTSLENQRLAKYESDLSKRPVVSSSKF